MPRRADIHLLIVSLIVFALLAFKLHQIQEGRLDITYQGDEAARLQYTIHDARKPFTENIREFVQSLLSIHPPGEQIFRLLLFKVIPVLGIEEPDYVKYALGLSTTIFSLTLLVIFHSGRILLGVLGGYWVLILAMMSKLLFYASVSSMGEMTGVPLIALSMFFLAKALLQPRLRDLIFSAICLLAASFIKSEVLLLLPGILLFLLVDRGLLLAILYGAISGLYVAVKIIVVRLFYPNIVQYGDRTYQHPPASFIELMHSDLIAKHFANDLTWPLMSLAVAGAAVLIVRAMTSREERRSLDFRAFVCFAAMAFSFLGSLLLAINLGLSHRAARTLTFPMLPMIICAACAHIAIFKTLTMHMRTTRMVRGAIVAFGLWLATIQTLRSYDDRQLETPHTYRAALAWIREYVPRNEAVFIDMLYFWEWYFLAHGLSTHSLIGTAAINPAADLFDTSSEDAWDPREAVSPWKFQAHFFIKHFDVRWFVMHGPSILPKFKRQQDWSMIYPDDDGPSQKRTAIEVKLLDSTSLTLHKVFSSPDVEIFERVDPLKPGNG